MDQASQMMRHPVRAFLLTPVFVAPLLFLAAIWIEPDLADSGSLFVIVVPFTAVVIGIVMVVLALPLYFLLRVLNLESALITIVLAGAIAGLVYWLPELVFPAESANINAQDTECQAFIDGRRTSCGWARFWKILAFYTCSGLFGGAVFWRLYSGRWV